MKHNSILNLNPDFCMGCGACYNKCPFDAVSMEMNGEGFFAPVIDENKCTECGMCSKVCPAMFPYKENNKVPDAYAAKTPDSVRMKSTSAGIFAVLSDYVLKKGGYVCGAAYNENFEVVHILANDTVEAEKIKKSKYVQSNVQLIFRDIKKLLDDGKMVLFSGTPCQVAALQNYLKSFRKDYDNLLTMDILCHGVPSPGNWKKYLEENIETDKLESIDFRHKGNHGFKKLYIQFKYKDGTETIMPSSANVFYKHFLKNLGLRKSCAHCEGSVFPRTGDFSAGDFWGAEQYYPDWIDNDNGISVITINNAKAAAVFEKIRPEFNMLNKISTKEAMTKNRRNVTRQMHPNRDNFLRSVAKTDFAKAEKANIKSKYDVALYGNTLGSNYGGIMTYFALYRYMSNIGKNVVMIRPPEGKSAPASDDFFAKYANLSVQRKLNDFRKYNNIADTFVIGSDQIWNYKLFSGKKLSYYLNFVDDSKKKIAYAASFGFEVPTVIDFKPEVYPKTFENLNKFDSIAVREIDGVDVCRKYYGSSAVHVLDPVFLVSREEYLEIAENAERKSEGKFLTVYTLTPGADYNKAIRFTAEKLGLPRVNMGPGTKKKYELKKKNFDEPYLVDTTIEEWIYNIANAEYVITDSYHCVCFSIIFRKKFIIVQKSWAISRIRSLLEQLGLTDRWIESSDELINNPDIIFKDIDYDKIYEILEKEVDISKNWLSNALDSPKNVSLHSIMFPEKMNVPVNDYFVSLRKSKDDYIYIAVKYEDNSDYLEPVNLPRNMNIGEKTKTNINNSPFVCICDPKSEISLKKKSDFPLVNYKYNDINFAAFSCKNEASGRCAKVTIENINGKKDIYNCNYESDGMYFFVYSKKRNKIIDVKFIGDDFITLNFN